MKIKSSAFSNLFAVLANLLLAYIVYMITRVAYVWENWSLFSAGWSELSLGSLLVGSLRFDTSAIFYTNSLYIVLMLLPLQYKERPWWHTMCKAIFVTVNSICMAANLADAVYSQFTGRRTTWSFFSEFANEGNLGNIFFTELLNHWYFVLLGALLIVAMIFLYVKPCTAPQYRRSYYYIVNAVALLLFIPLSVAAMRGGFTKAIRPIANSNANQYVNTPAEAAIVLNTPFSMLRTSGKKPFVDPHYYTPEQLDELYSPVVVPTDSTVLSGKNVVVLILESFGREYFGYYNKSLDNGTYHGYTPFLDSLLDHSLTFDYTFANGRKSIDAMPSILSSIPMFVEPFFVSTTSLNDVDGIAACLDRKGYTTAFFHGADNGSMGFQAFARTTGFQTYYGRTEYEADSRFGGSADFDGTWAIWDEPFLQFFALKMSELQQPFMTSVFTASSHHPFAIPEQYRGVYHEGQHPIHKCILYSDNALRRFFATAKQQPWYDNTIFVLTADHTNHSNHDVYLTSLGAFSVPIIFFDPSGSLPREKRNGVAAQIDIMPTILGLLGYDEPYIAFGKDLLSGNTPTWTVNYSNGIYQYVDGPLVLLFDGERQTALYNYVDDPLQQHNLMGTQPEHEHQMLTRLKAIIQSYMIRMTTNNLTVKIPQQ